MKFINELDNLRGDIYLNSKEILELLEKRKELAEKIGDVKNSKGMSIRNREREIEILKTLSSDGFEESVLNILFEFSIHYEEKPNIDPGSLHYPEIINGIRYIKYSGEYDNLIFLLASIFNPGSLIQCKNKSISETMGRSGHHIVDYVDNPDIIINLDGAIQDIILRDNSLLISERFIENKNRIYSIVIE